MIVRLRNIFSILLINGYSDYVIEKTIVCKLKDLTSHTLHKVKKSSVDSHLPWLGALSVGLENNIKASVEKCFFAVKQRFSFTSRPLLTAIKKDVLPASLLSNVIYNFRATVIVGTWAEDLNDYRTKVVNMFQNLLEPAKFQTLAIFLFVLTNLQPQSWLVNVRLVNTFWTILFAPNITVMKNLLFFHLVVRLFIYLL